MDNHSVTIELPDDVFQRLSQLAKAMNRPVAEVVAQSFVGIFPPE
jgi:predicted transcriptional regulator